MQTRALIKERARRNLLLLIDGSKTEEMLLANLAGISAEDFQELRKLDLIAPAAGAVTVGNPSRATAFEATRPILPHAARRQVARLQRVHRRPDQAHLGPARAARVHADPGSRQGLDDRGTARRRPARARADPREEGRGRRGRGAKDALRRLRPARRARAGAASGAGSPVPSGARSGFSCWRCSRSSSSSRNGAGGRSPRCSGGSRAGRRSPGSRHSSGARRAISRSPCSWCRHCCWFRSSSARSG